LLGGEPLGGDAARGATLHERLEILEIFVADRHEQTIVQFERPRSDAPQDPVLLDTLDGRLSIADCIAAAAVQQPVVAPGRAGGQLTAFDERYAKTPQREVVREPGSGCAASDDEDLRMLPSGSHRDPPRIRLQRTDRRAVACTTHRLSLLIASVASRCSQLSGSPQIRDHEQSHPPRRSL